MLVDSPYAGDWMASAYTSGGKRTDCHLFLDCDGTFERVESNTATVTINVTDTAPTAVNQIYAVHQGQTLNVSAANGLLNGSFDADGDSLTANIVSYPSEGMLGANSDGSFSYTPEGGFVGVDTFTYDVFDGAEYSGTQTVTISVTDTAPTALGQAYGVQAGQTLNVSAAAGLLNGAYDADGDSLTANIVSYPNNGMFSANPDGSFSYTPDGGFTGVDTFTYNVFDGAEFSGTQTVLLAVGTVGMAAPGDQANFDGDTVSLPILAADGYGNSLAFSETGLPPGLSLATNSSGGVYVTGNIATTADQNSPYTVTITATDSVADASASQTFSWAVSPVSLTVSSPGNQSNYDGDTVSLGFTANDDAGHTVTWTAVGLPPGLSISATTGTIGGTIAANADADSPYYVTVTAADAAADLSVGANFDWTVSPVTVSLTQPPDQSNYDGDVVSLSLAPSDSAGHQLTYTETGLPPGLIVTNSGSIEGVIEPGADANSPYYVAVTATDSAADVSATVNFSSTISPVTLSLTQPADQSNLDGDTVSLQLAATDSAGHALAYTAEGLPPGLSMTQAGEIFGSIGSTADSGSPYTVTVTAGDNTVGISATETFTWTVSPSVVILTNPGEQFNYDGDTVSLALAATDAYGNSLTYAETGLPPGLSIDASTGVISGTVAAGADAESPYSVTVTATDSTAGASDTQPFSYYVAAVQVLVSTPANQSNLPGDTVSLAVANLDTGGHALTFSATNLPDGLTIDPDTGTITGTVAADAVSATPYEVTIAATDSAAGATAGAAFDWTVGDVALSGPGDQYNSDGDVVSVANGASAINGDPVTFSAVGLPPGLAINASTGLISGTIAPSSDADSPYSVTVTATDTTTDASASQAFAWNVELPVVYVFGPGDGMSVAGSPVSVGVSAVYTAGHSLTFSAANLPAGLSINPDTGAITGTIATSAISATPYDVTVTATDSAAGVSATASFDLTVTEIWLNNPGYQRSLVGGTANITLSASDVLGNTLTYSATNLPAGLSINPSTGVISGTPSAAGVYNVTVAASAGSATVTQAFTWTVNQITLQDPGSKFNEPGDTVNLALTATAPAGDPITFSAVGLPAGLSINPTTGVISGTIASGTTGNFTVILTATDTTTGASASGAISWGVSYLGAFARNGGGGQVLGPAQLGPPERSYWAYLPGRTSPSYYFVTVGTISYECDLATGNWYTYTGEPFGSISQPPIPVPPGAFHPTLPPLPARLNAPPRATPFNSGPTPLSPPPPPRPPSPYDPDTHNWLTSGPGIFGSSSDYNPFSPPRSNGPGMMGGLNVLHGTVQFGGFMNTQDTGDNRRDPTFSWFRGEARFNGRGVSPIWVLTY